MDKVLLVSNVASMMCQFNKHNIEILQKTGYEVHLACNFIVGNNASEEVIDKFRVECEENNIKCHQINFLRTIFNGRIFETYKEIKNLICENDFEMIHVHSPIAGVLARIAARKLRKKGVKVIYTAHGFHFYKGAPLVNWLIYYPIEWVCAWLTDCLITINREDYERAKKHMHTKKIEYISGVGVNIKEFKSMNVDKKEKRREIGVPEDAFVVLSVGELNKNKNHETIIRAVANLNNPQVHYVIAGIGPMREELIGVAKELGIEKNLHMIGYRNDIVEIYKCADIFCFPSHREGLGLSAIEAMASGMPIVTSNIHGICDYSINGETGFCCSPTNVSEFKASIKKLIEDSELREEMGRRNANSVEKYSYETIKKEMKNIYESVLMGVLNKEMDK